MTVVGEGGGGRTATLSIDLLLLLGVCVSRADREISRDDGLVVTYAVYGLCRFGKSMF